MNYRKEISVLATLFIVLFIIAKIVFFLENFFVVLRLVASLFWLFVLPGYAIMLYWNESLDLPKRLLLGFALSAAVLGISSYYLGILGLHIRYHLFVIPTAMIILGIVLEVKKKK
ncbi:MAG: hypothetical protein V1837_08505 [Candidatus Woesearchaeota archaeon]